MQKNLKKIWLYFNGLNTILKRIFLSIYRCTRVYNPESGIELNGRHSSSADEGFTSGSSPVNGISTTNTNMPILLSPQSSDTQDTAHLVSSESCSSTTSSTSSSSSNSAYPPIAPRKPHIKDCLARESTV